MTMSDRTNDILISCCICFSQSRGYKLLIVLYVTTTMRLWASQPIVRESGYAILNLTFGEYSE